MIILKKDHKFLCEDGIYRDSRIYAKRFASIEEAKKTVNDNTILYLDYTFSQLKEDMTTLTSILESNTTSILKNILESENVTSLKIELEEKGDQLIAKTKRKKNQKDNFIHEIMTDLPFIGKDLVLKLPSLKRLKTKEYMKYIETIKTSFIEEVLFICSQKNTLQIQAS